MSKDSDEPSSESTESDEETPLSELAADIEQRRARASESEESELFEEVEVEEIDVEEVWESLEEAENEGVETARVGAGAEAEHIGRASPTDEREEWIVPKRAYCQRCQFFGDPPNPRCTNEGTDIVEAVDMDHFRVRGCPMVGEGGLSDVTETE